MIEIANAGFSDLPGITAIFNEAIVHSVAAFHLEPRTDEQQREWFAGHGPKHPVIVARADGAVVGWASLNLFLPRHAYEHTVEDSIYVAEGWRGKGIGRRLLTRLIELAKELGHHTIVARIAGRNPASIPLHRSLGFEEVGTLRDAGRKFDRWVDVTLMQLVLSEESDGSD